MTLEEITILLASWSDYMWILVAVISLFTIRRNRYFWILSVYLFLIAPLYIETSITADYELNNNKIYYIIGFIELVFTFWLYRNLGFKHIWNWIFMIVVSIYTIDLVYNLIQDEEEINSIGQSVNMLFIILLGFNFIWKLYQEEKVEYLGFYPYFYISGGLTIFASGAFFGYLFIARMTPETTPAESFFYLWIIISGFNYIKFILIVLGIFVERKYAK